MRLKPHPSVTIVWSFRNFMKHLSSLCAAFALATTAASLQAQAVSQNPTISAVQPAAGRITSLQQLTVVFSAPVQGVSAQDLLVNNQPADSVVGSGANYIF